MLAKANIFHEIGFPIANPYKIENLEKICARPQINPRKPASRARKPQH